MVLFTSGQQLGPMAGELAHAASKAALAGIPPALPMGSPTGGSR